MGSYLEWMSRGFSHSGVLDNADKVARAIWLSSRQAINNLNSVAAVCNANLTLSRRQEVIDAFKSNLPVESLRKLREAPFDSRDLVPDDLFREVLQETRAARHDDVLLEPIRQRHTYRGGRNSSPSRGGSGTLGRRRYRKSSGKGKGGDFQGQTARGGASFRGNFNRQSDGGSSSAHVYRGGKKKGGAAAKSGGGEAVTGQWEAVCNARGSSGRRSARTGG